MDIKKIFGKNLKNIRFLKDLTQEELAEKLNISAKSLSQIECGNNFVSAETLSHICTALDIKPKKLFDIDNEQEDMDTSSEIFIKLKNNPELAKIIKKIVRALDD